MKPPTDAVVVRNRLNARRSTGPITPGGKAASRCNAVRHGLRANPAAGTVEQAGRFRALLGALEERLRPRDPLEQALVHRIGVAIWRLERAVRVEAAITSEQVDGQVPEAAQVQQWVERIRSAWRVEHRQVPRFPGAPGKDGRIMRTEGWRPDLSGLDDLRGREMLASGTALTAMMELLRALMLHLRDSPEDIGKDECEQIAWLLGESCWRMPVGAERPYPDEAPAPSTVEQLIGSARRRRRGRPLPPALTRLVRQRMNTLRMLRETCREPYTSDFWRRRRVARSLPDAAVMDVLLRYESHADRTLARSLETLARLRGLTVERVSASLSGTDASGAAFAVEREQTVVRVPGVDGG